MNKKLFIKIAMFCALSFVTFSTLTFASNEDRVKVQGKIMELDLKRNTMVVVEKTFFWDQKTVIHNEKGSPTSMDKFKPKTWVYIEGMKDKKNNRILIEKIYLLPKYVDKKERHLYPFMDLE